MSFTAITICLIVMLIIFYMLFRRWHMKWLDTQNPLGVWTTEYEENHINIQFDQDTSSDAKEGTYKQITRTNSNEELKEFGHWWTSRQMLRMLILASDVPNHPRFGQDTVYSITYTGPEEITISGPDREYLVYHKAPEGTIVEFPEEKKSNK